jgi:ribosomal protein S27E
MAKREFITSHLKCEDCGTTGTAEWSENENPVHGRGLDSKLLSVSDGFKAGIGTVAMGDQAIECTGCGKIINASG